MMPWIDRIQIILCVQYFFIAAVLLFGNQWAKAAYFFFGGCLTASVVFMK
jgi:hypothetical protein